MRKGWGHLKSIMSSPDFPYEVVVTLGILLRLRQYFANRSFWVDEASLALNIINRSFGGLTRPLDYEQGAPIGFLFIEKILVLLLGNSEFILRLFPLVSGLLSVYLIWRITKKSLGLSGIFPVLMIALSSPLIYYSSELKQYSSDIMFSLLIIYLTIFCLRASPKTGNYILLGIAGAFSIWVSHPSIFVLAGVGLILAYKALSAKAYKQIIPILSIGVTWALMLGLTYLISLRYLVGNTYLKEYWVNGFMPFPPWNHLNWFQNAFSSLLGNIDPIFEQPYWTFLFFVLFVSGLISYFSRDRDFAILISVPFLMVLLASALQQYPFSGRLIFFLVPSLVLFIAEGLSLVYTLLVEKWKYQVAIFAYGLSALFLLAIPGCFAVQNFITPPMDEHIRPVLAYVQTNIRAGDTIYVYSGSVTPFRYYASTYGLDLGTTIVPENSGGVNQFLRDVNRLEGRNRVWFIFSHVIGCGNCKGDKLQFYVQSLNEYGVQVDNFQTLGAATFLYDLRP